MDTLLTLPSSIRGEAHINNDADPFLSPQQKVGYVAAVLVGFSLLYPDIALKIFDGMVLACAVAFPALLLWLLMMLQVKTMWEGQGVKDRSGQRKRHQVYQVVQQRDHGRRRWSQ